MLAHECYELRNLTLTNVLVCPFCYFVRNSGKYFEREDGTYSFYQPQYSHTCHLKEYNFYSNYSVRIQLLMSLRNRTINACISLGILFSILPSFSARLITVLWCFSSGSFSSFQYVVFRYDYLINFKYIFDLKFIQASVFPLNEINSTLTVIESWTYILFTDKSLQTEVWIRGNYNGYCGLIFMI